MGHELTKGGVVGVDVRGEEFCEHVGLLAGCRSGGGDFTAGLLFDVFGAVAGSCFQAAGKGLFLCLKRLGKAVEEWIEGSVERKVVEDGKDQEEDHEDQRTWGFGDAEEADETNFSQVDSGQGLLECAWVEQALGVDLGVGDEEDVVSVGEVKESHADGREAQN